MAFIRRLGCSGPPGASSTQSFGRSVVGRHRRLEAQPPGVVGDAVRRRRPLRNHVMAVQQHAVERAAGRQQIGLGLGGRRSAADQRVDRRVLDADEVARAFGLGGLAAEDVGQLAARDVGAREVMVTMSKSKMSSRCWYSAKSTGGTAARCPAFRGCASTAPRCGCRPRLLSRYSMHEGSPLALRSAPSRYVQPASLSSACAWRRLSRSDCGAVGAGRHGHRAEHAPAAACAQRLQQRQLVAARHAGGLAIGVAEKALAPAGSAVEQLPVHPLVVERQPERLAHPQVLELGPPRC